MKAMPGRWTMAAPRPCRPTDYPGIGRCAYVEDGQGNVVGMITPEGGNLTHGN